MLSIDLTPTERAEREAIVRNAPPKTWIVIDEAQDLIPAGRKTAATGPLIKLVKEGRNFGLSLVITTQQPRAVDSRVLSQVETFLIEDRELKEWARTERVHVAHPENDDTVTVEAQFYYLSRYQARSGWLSPKGVEEFVEVLPRRLGLLDDVYRRTESGQILSEILTSTEEHESWSQPSLRINPFRLSLAQAYFLLHAVVEADGDFIIPWLRALVDRHQRAEFSYLEAGQSIPEVLESMETAFAGTSYLDSDRRQLAAVESARLRIEREIDARIERQGSGSRRDQIAVPRLEWMVDLGLLVRREPDTLNYRFSEAGTAIVGALSDAYCRALDTGFADNALQDVLDGAYAGDCYQLLDGAAPKAGDLDIINYLSPAYKKIDSISGYCLVRPLCLLATITSAQGETPIVVEYRDVVQAIESRYQAEPEAIHYTVDRLSTDYQVKLTPPPAH